MIKLNFKTILYFFVFLAFFPLLTLVSLASPENVETEKVGERIGALAKIENESIQKAQNDFRISLEKAVFDLKK